MEKRTPEGKKRHDLGKKIYYEKKKKEKIEHEISNGLKLLGKRIRISDFKRNKILSGKLQVMVIGGELVLFRKKTDNGYWFNNHNKTHGVLYLHREKVKQEYGLTEEQMEGKDVHHIDGNKNNNDISNLELLSKEEHRALHGVRKKSSLRHVCKKCGRTYYSSVSKSVDICDRCVPELATESSSMITIKKICEYCGMEYETNGVNKSRSKFCSNKCKSAYRRVSGVDKIDKMCMCCGNIFKSNKYNAAQYCCSRCASVGRSLL